MADTLSRLTDRSAATATVTLAADPDDAPRLQAAADAVKRARRLLEAASDAKETAAAEARLEDAETAHADLTAEIVTISWEMAGIGPTAVEALIANHPPTAEQVKEARKNGDKRPQYNEETLAVELIALLTTSVAYSDEPDAALSGLTVEQMEGLWKSKLSVQDRGLLYVTAIGLDQRGSSLPDLGKG